MVNTRKLAPGFLLIVAGLAALIGPGVWALDEEGPGTRDPGCWQAAITQQWINTELAGSVLRVAVHGRAGLPVVVFNNGSEQCLVTNESTGLVVKNESEYTEALERLYHDPALREKLGAQARVYARGHFSLTAMVQQWQDLLL